MSVSKPRVIKDYAKLDAAIQEQIKLVYPFGFSDNLITFNNKEGKLISALPFETDDKYYLIKMSVIEAEQIIEDDDDYNDDGFLKNRVKEGYEEKYADIDYLKDAISDEDLPKLEDDEEDDKYADDDVDGEDEDEDED